MMRTMFFSVFCLISGMTKIAAQEKITGVISDSNTGETLAGATVLLVESFKGVTSDAQGRFEIKGVKAEPLLIRVSFLGYQTYNDTIFPPFKSEYHITLVPHTIMVKEVEIAGIRVSENTPVTQSLLTETDIQKQNLGQDIPYLLDQTPSVVTFSDAGAGIGYSAMRIRGTDATRVNVTINGVPLNDPESQMVVWVDLPDMGSSISSMQVQRGVGSSSLGPGSFGGTISIQTNQLKAEPYVEIASSAGMFMSFKNTVEFGTGLLAKHFSFTGRLSKISSDGYIDRAWSDLKSFFLSGGYYGKKTTVRFNIFSGHERTYQAWYGVPGTALDTARTYNPAGMDWQPNVKPYDNEIDNYQQDHYQLFVDQQTGKYNTLNLAVYYTRGRGYYEQMKYDQLLSDYGLPPFYTQQDTLYYTNAVQQLWLDNHLVGANFTSHYTRKKWDVVVGAAFNTYFGNHYGKLVWSISTNEQEFYRHASRKMDGSAYAKASFEAYPGLHIYADLQYRIVYYTTDGFRYNPTIQIKNVYHFVNPKVGVNYRINSDHTLYLFFGMARKEPNRDDFEAGVNQQPKPEWLRDLEVGYKHRGKIYELMGNIYWMDYTDQLVQSGKVNDVGAYARINIPRSYRLGIELSGQVRPHRTFLMKAHAAFSLSKITDFTEYIDNFDTGTQDSVFYSSSDLAFSPNIVAGFVFTYTPIKNFDIELTGKYVSHQYLDNTASSDRRIAPFFVNDLRLRYELSFKKHFYIRFNLMVNNFTNRMYEPNGYTFGYIISGERKSENYYYPQAGIHVMGGITLGFQKANQ